MENQDNFLEDQEFDLDSILEEFRDAPEEPAEAAPAPEPDAPAPEEPKDDSAAPAQTETAAPDLEARLDSLLSNLTLDAPDEEETTDQDTIVFDPPEAESEEAPESPEPAEPDAAENATLPDDATQRLDPAQDTESDQQVPADPIVLRTRLQELKRKLIAGPEKRYYDLSEVGVFRLQIAILLNILVSALCIAVTILFASGVVPENRLRLVIFSQVLAMLLSALLGSQQLLDGLGELFHARFSLNTLLFFTLIACCGDAVFCLQELRIPCCSCFTLEMTFALLARYHRRSTEMSQMDTLRKAGALYSVVKEPDYLDGKPGILRGEGDVDDFTATYNKPSSFEKAQCIYAFAAFLLSLSIATLAGLRHSPSLALQVLSTALLAAAPASYFVSLTRPAALLERRLHMVGSVFCGWQGVAKLRGKAYFPITDEDLFPTGSAKLNGVKFYGSRGSEQILSYTTSLIAVAGGGLVGLFRNMLKNRGGSEYPVADFRDYGIGGVGGEVCGEAVLLGNLDFMQSMGVEIPQGTTVSQAVYASIGGQLCAVIAISYAKMRSASAGLVSLNGYRKVRPVVLADDFMLTKEFINAKFSVNTRRMVFPDRETRRVLAQRKANPESTVLAMATRSDLVSTVYTITGASALYTSNQLGTLIHMLGGIVGMVIMLALAWQGSAELLTPTRVLLYQLIWMVPGLLVTEWTRTV